MLILVALTAVSAGGVAMANAHSPRNGRTGAKRTLAANQTAARADAVHLLSTVTLPADALRIGSGTTHAPSFIPTTAGVTDAANYRVPSETPTQVLEEVKAAPPTDVISTGTSSSSGPKGVSSLGLVFTLRTLPDVLDARMIEVTVSARAGGGSTVVIDAESVWVVPRTAASMLPAATHVISVSASNARGTVLESATITAPARVTKTLVFFNSLQASQPFAVECPAQLAGADLIKVDFLTRVGAPLLAQTRFTEASGGTSGVCSTVALTIGDRPQTSLLGGAYIAALDRLLNVRLPVSRS